MPDRTKLRLVGKEAKAEGPNELIEELCRIIREAGASRATLALIVIPDGDDLPSPYCVGDPVAVFAAAEEICRSAKLESLGLA